MLVFLLVLTYNIHTHTYFIDAPVLISLDICLKFRSSRIDTVRCLSLENMFRILKYSHRQFKDVQLCNFIKLGNREMRIMNTCSSNIKNSLRKMNE